MNALKNMEAIFIVAVAVSFSAAAFAKAPTAAAPVVRTAAAPTIANNTKMIKVVITGKRLSRAEKAQLAAL